MRFGRKVASRHGNVDGRRYKTTAGKTYMDVSVGVDWELQTVCCTRARQQPNQLEIVSIEQQQRHHEQMTRRQGEPGSLPDELGKAQLKVFVRLRRANGINAVRNQPRRKI